jgi:bifunctional DNA-binding transcriptional regulator/antitoxin component of YhaV-PrlF toxin-antitoxin module
MSSNGHLKVSSRGQMSLPSSARNRWKLQDGGEVTYLDLGDVVLLVPEGIQSLRNKLIDSVDETRWAEARAGFGDPDLATE